MNQQPTNHLGLAQRQARGRFDQAVFSARAAVHEARKGDGPQGDRFAFSAAYAILLDFDEATAVADLLLTEWTDKRRVPKLPDLRGEVVVVNGERLRRPAPFYYHGSFVFVEDEQKWYMATRSQSIGMSWSAQEPFESNQSWFRQQAADAIDELATEVGR